MTETTSPLPTGWLKTPQFDLCFIIGIAVLAIAAGFIAQNQPQLFVPLLVADLWLLGYHHVIATFTRTAFDRESFREHKAMVLYLPILVAFAVTLLALSFGPWILATIYLHWQWYHYTRQSEGISKAYIGKNPGRSIGEPKWARLAFYSVPVAGILHMSARAPETFLFMPVQTVSVPLAIVWTADAAAGLAVAAWLSYHAMAAIRGRLALSYFLYMLSHFAIYLIAYIVIDDVNYGWLTINIWHNAQYILFVWLFNNKRFGNKIDTKRRLLSTLSQTNRFPLYIATCLTISTATYYLIQSYGVGFVSNNLGVSAAVAAGIIYQTINFHHYIVDSRIWKLRKKTLRVNLDLA